jgi:hypothetical protein
VKVDIVDVTVGAQISNKTQMIMTLICMFESRVEKGMSKRYGRDFISNFMIIWRTRKIFHPLHRTEN